MPDNIVVDSFLIGKSFGQPYMPKNFTELVFLVTIISRIWLVRIKAWILLTYFNDNIYPWNYFYLARDLFLAYLVIERLSSVFSFVYGYGVVGATKRIAHSVSTRVAKFILSLPPIKKKIDAELSSTIGKMEGELMKNDEKLLQLKELPNEGLKADVIVKELDKLQELKHSNWLDGRVSGAVYHGGDELLQLQSTAYHKYSVANQLHPDVFPGVRKMESEVVSMVLNIFNAPPEGCGATTSGGTESLLLAGLSAREFARQHKGISHFEVIAPVTVHAGIEKACYYFGMTLHKVDLDPKTYQVDINKVKRLINSNTVLLVGSAPNYPHGIIDDIEELSKLAVKYKIPLHVDACLGSFIVSFLERSKVHGEAPIPLFDFRLPGVTSISCDTHKYGFAPKGSSIIMYRNPQLRECQYYISTDWTGGMYGSSTLAGSRPGALMVGCWATLVNVGIAGYEKSCRDIVSTSMKVKKAIRNDKILRKYLDVIGEPIASVIAFKLKDDFKQFNIYQLGDVLNKKGWHFSTLQRPSALHFAFTRLTVPVVDDLLADLVESIEELVEKTKDSAASKSDTAALYGVAGSISTVGVADRVIVAFLDTLYKV
ncbi:dihydrosphingosine-1-phosphate lyase [Scheffersomyces xylosifermentans]|uniref:dihydrosphingosine-1-phosphate lyase n=1 Tax=Scheffersomyces xylosifermentans TaxID=1304137 RepID=UPI00315DA5D6